MGPSDITLQSIGFRVLTLLIVSGIQGGLVAGTAVLLGDRGPGYDGRLSIAPARHLDLLGAIALVIFGWGWSKPVEVDARQFRTGRAGLVLVVLVGFLGLLLAAALLGALIRPALTTLPHASGLATAAFLRAASSLTVGFALLSLVPIPPLAGGLLLEALGLRVPRGARQVFAIALFAAVAAGGVRQLLGPVQAVLASLVLLR